MVSSLALRGLLAIVLMIGFYALALGIAGGLLYIPYAEWVYGERLHLRLVLFSVITAGLILFSILPRRDRFVPPGPLLDPATQPRLFERLTALSRALGQPMPRDVYLVSDLNAWVAERGGILGIGGRRVMGLGLPLMQVLTQRQFEAVLAHEFGHYHGGDTRLGPWIYKTRAAMGRTLQSLEPDRSEGFSIMSVIQWPFRLYANLYLRVTLAISRAQEFSADRLAAGITGAAALIEGLRSVHRVAGAANHYLQNDVWPVVRQGFRPPIVQGLGVFLANEKIGKFMDDLLAAQLASPDRGVFDTHPPLKDRIEALQALPPGRIPADDPAALTLLQHVEDLEARLAATWLAAGAPQLKPIQWSETGDAVLLPYWQALIKRAGRALDGVTLQNLDDTARNLDPFARKLNAWKAGDPWEPVRQFASSVLGRAAYQSVRCCRPDGIRRAQGTGLERFDRRPRSRSGNEAGLALPMTRM
jgi:Zn-dependent protease with chaperone function